MLSVKYKSLSFNDSMVHYSSFPPTNLLTLLGIETFKLLNILKDF